MVNNGCVTLDELKHEIIIQNLIVTNPEIYDFLSDKKDPEAWIQKGLIIGCIGLKQMVIVENVDYIEREFQKFTAQTNKIFEKFDIKNTDSPLYQIREILMKYFDNDKGDLKILLDSYFNKDQGEIKKIIDQNFDINNKTSAFSVLLKEIRENSDLEEDTIKELLDPNKADSPIKRLKEELFKQVKDVQETDLKEIALRIKELKDNELKDIRDKLIGEEARDEEYSRGTKKGTDFEEEVYLQMEQLARPFNDNISHEGTKRGKTGKAGDIIIDINGDHKKRLVIECKNKEMKVKEVRNEIIDVINNRNAKFVIYLFSSEDLIPEEFSPFKIESNFIITSMEKHNLHISYRLARELLDITKNRGTEIEHDKMVNLLNEIEIIIRDIHQMEIEAQKILTSGNYLKTNLEKLHANVEIRIGKIKAHLGS
jgi:hypothetical protein